MRIGKEGKREVGWKGGANKRRDLLSRGACNPILKAHRVNTPTLVRRRGGGLEKERLINSVQYAGTPLEHSRQFRLRFHDTSALLRLYARRSAWLSVWSKQAAAPAL